MNPHALAEEIVRTMPADDAFSAWLGIEVLEIGPGRSRLRMPVREDMLNGFGRYHGGVLFPLAEERSHGERITTFHVSVTNQDARRAGIFRGTAYRTRKALFTGSGEKRRRTGQEGI